MRLLVTRPEPDAAGTAARLRALGHQALVQPLLNVAFTDPPDATRPAALVLTSRNGVRALERWPEAADWHGIPVFAVGDATAEGARAAGFEAVASAAGDGPELAGMILGLQPSSAGPLLYPAAEDRAPALEDRLRAAGYDLQVVVAYRTVPAEGLAAEVRAGLADGSLQGVLLYSQRTAAIFRDLVIAAGLRASLGRCTLFALSQGIASAVRHLAAGAIMVAARPDEASLLALIPPGGETAPAG